ncbi:MAG: pantoate--beta-alanine ligase [Gaiellaceae bacterium]
MRVARSVTEIRAALEPLRGGSTLGLVPTMGAFHEGHLSLFHAARAECDAVVASLFVNPTQFGEEADLEAYPRDEARDLAEAEAAGIDFLFAPPPVEIYPPGFQTWVEVAEVSRGLEGDARPGHFRGVATVCLKLFHIVHPQHVYFGQKDAQQAALIRTLVRDLELELIVRVLPTVRDADGLALSSRNARLTPEERERALVLPRALQSAASSDDPVATARSLLNGLQPDYVAELELGGSTVLAAAARVGSVRLIDNVLLKGDL